MGLFPPSYKYYHDIDGNLKSTPFHWAFAKQTRSQPGSREPRAGIVLKKSQAAQLLCDARAGDENAEQRLINIIINNITRIAAVEQWTDELDGRAETMATLGLWDAIYDAKPLSQNKSCMMLGVKNSRAWHSKWQPRVFIIKSWVKSWSAQ